MSVGAPPASVEPTIDPRTTHLTIPIGDAFVSVPVHRRAARDLGPKADWKRRYAHLDDLAADPRGPLDFAGGGALVDADTGRLVVLYVEADPTRYAPIAALLRPHRPKGKTHRQSGMAGLTKVFGFMPRKKGRQDWCRATKFSAEHPEAAARLEAVGAELSAMYAHAAPALHAWHAEQVAALADAFTPADGVVYTSGIVNYDYNIPYHFDAGNVTHTWSAMLGLKRGIEGGGLVIPAYGAFLPIADGSVTLFDGQSVLHGVTPFKAHNASSYRITAVFYTLRDMWQCLPPDEELARFRKARLAQERKRRAADRERRRAARAEEE